MRHFLILPALAVLLSACGVTRQYSLADGTVQTFRFRGEFPESSSNDWAIVEAAALKGERGDDEVFRVGYAFNVRLLRTDVRSIVVEDVTAPPVRMLVRDDAVTPMDAKWSVGSPERPLTDPAWAWLRDEKDDVHNFKITMRVASGEEKSIYQPSFFPGRVDSMMLLMQNSSGVSNEAASSDRSRVAPLD